MVYCLMAEELVLANRVAASRQRDKSFTGDTQGVLQAISLKRNRYQGVLQFVFKKYHPVGERAKTDSSSKFRFAPMGKTQDKSRAHFIKVVTKVTGSEDKITWKCEHCKKDVMTGQFKVQRARIHLAAEKTNGMCVNLCDDMGDKVEERREEYRLVLKNFYEKQAETNRKRKQTEARLQHREAQAILSGQNKKKKKKHNQISNNFSFSV